MSTLTTIRAWKDASFRATLTDAQRSALPASPVGTTLTELDADQLRGIAGGQEPGGCGLICTVTYDCAGSYLEKKACDIWHVGD